MNAHTIKKQIQSILGNGLVIIVGCGLSAAEGLPGMYDLGEHLVNTIPSSIPDDVKDLWAEIENQLKSGIGLEASMAGIEIPDSLKEAIIYETSNCIRSKELQVIEEVLKDERVLRFGHLINALPETQENINIVTTNYDRLIEIACESVGRNIDSLFLGNSIGRLDPKESAFSFCRGIRKRQGKMYLDYAQRIKLFKPHGSLDWYSIQGKPIRCPYCMNLSPLIIAPGETKYRAGYKEPFDLHRERANQAINQGKKYLIIGYGFNDDHLQTHLERNLEEGKQGLIVTHSVSEATLAVMDKSPNVMALSVDSNDNTSTSFRYNDGTIHSISGDLWDIGNLVKEVLI